MESKDGIGLQKPGDQCRVQAELTDQLYKQTPIGIIATLVNSAILVFILWNRVPHPKLLCWLEVSTAISLLRLGLIWAYRASAFQKPPPHRWRELQVAGIAISGLVWGSAGIFLFPADSTAHEAFIAVVLAGMVAGAVGMCSSVFGGFVAFSLPALLPILLRFLRMGDDLHMAMGVMTLLFLVLTSLTAWRINVAATELVMLKESFAEKVAERTNDLEQANEEVRLALREKEVLLKEIHHRVKNNLAVIISILKMRSSRIDDPSGKEALQDCYERVEAMALIHETLCLSGDLAAIPLAAYARDLSANLMQMMLSKEERSNIDVIIDADGVHLPIDEAMPCGLILNELLTNSFKYAFGGRASGQILIAARIGADGIFELSFCDNGVGLPSGLDLEKCGSLGFRIISVLVKHQMEGAWEAKNDNGAIIRIRWPTPTKEGRYDRRQV